MALINCPECQLEISSKAHACPRCAYPMDEGAVSPAPPVIQARPASSWLPWVLCGVGTLALALALIVVLFMGRDEPASTAASAVDQPTEASATAGASPKEMEAAPPPLPGGQAEPAVGEMGQGAAPAGAPDADEAGDVAAPAGDKEEAVAGEAAAPAPAPVAPAPVDNRSREEKRYGPGKKVARYWVTKDTVVDLKRERYWQRGSSRKPLTWGAAYNYCKKLKLAGKTGWRLPSILQLKGLLRGCAASGQCGNYKSGISCRHCGDNSGPGDKGWFMQRGAWKNPKYSWFWASTPHASRKGYHYSMFFAGAYINYYKNSEPYHARCFRKAD